MRKVAVGLLFIFMLIPFCTQAQEQEVKLSVSDELTLRLKLVSTMVQFQKRLESEFGKDHDFVTLLANDQQYREAFEGKYAQLAQEYLDQELEHLPLSPTLKRSLRERLGPFHWRTMAARVAQMLASAHVFVRTHGVAQALIYVANTTFQFTIPPLLMANGQPFLATVLFYASGDIPVFLAHNFLKRHYIKYRLMSLMGGRHHFDKYEAAMKAAATELKLTDVLKDIVVPFNAHEALVIESVNPLQAILKRLGLRSGKVSLRRIKQFIKEQKIGDELVHKVLSSSRYSDTVKISLILPRLFEQMNDLQETAFRARFHSSLTELPQIAYGSEIEKWVLTVVKAKTWDEVQLSFLRAPAQMRPMQMVMVWEHVLLPYFAKRTELLSYREYRHLSRSFAKVKARAFLTRYEIDHDYHPKLWTSYLQLRGCDVSLGQLAAAKF